ncbi:uncharacterized protein LOC142242512 isoform X2 [Haematobia irritans]|uniref:uncharacterized protein LOC142242512 isoform X2 n=1 Tax=Haematobia irritans TaxID=7368 RepID=UPI003F4FCCB3
MSNNLNQEENDANIGLEDNNNATNGTITNQRDMQMQTSGVQPIDERYNNDSGSVLFLFEVKSFLPMVQCSRMIEQ